MPLQSSPSQNGSIGVLVDVLDGNGGTIKRVVPAHVTVSADGSTPGTKVYQLATAQSLASGASTTPVTGITGGSYIWNVVGTFSGGSTVALQSLASDGTTWQTVGTAVTASGNVGVVLGNNASVRLLGGVATTTGLSSSLS